MNQENHTRPKVAQCEMCGAIYIENLYGVCENCIEEDQQLYHTARDSIKFGEIVTPEIVSERTGIEVKHIMRWIRKGRLSVSA